MVSFTVKLKDLTPIQFTNTGHFNANEVLQCGSCMTLVQFCISMKALVYGRSNLLHFKYIRFDSNLFDT